MAFEFEIKGLDFLTVALGDLVKKVPDVAGQALREEAEIEMEEAKRRTPVDTGALRSSGRVTSSEDGLAVTLSFGDTAVDYALPVHEDLEMLHRVGQAKYLESVLVESSPYLVKRIAKRMGQILGSQ